MMVETLFLTEFILLAILEHFKILIIQVLNVTKIFKEVMSYLTYFLVWAGKFALMIRTLLKYGKGHNPKWKIKKNLFHLKPLATLQIPLNYTKYISTFSVTHSYISTKPTKVYFVLMIAKDSDLPYKEVPKFLLSYYSFIYVVTW